MCGAPLTLCHGCRGLQRAIFSHRSHVDLLIIEECIEESLVCSGDVLLSREDSQSIQLAHAGSRETCQRDTQVCVACQVVAISGTEAIDHGIGGASTVARYDLYGDEGGV